MDSKRLEGVIVDRRDNNFVALGGPGPDYQSCFRDAYIFKDRRASIFLVSRRATAVFGWFKSLLTQSPKPGAGRCLLLTNRNSYIA